MSANQKPILLVIHDDIQLVRQITKMTSELRDVIHARDIGRVTQWLESNHKVDAVIVGRPFDGLAAAEMLAIVKLMRPSVRRFMLGDPHDLSATVQALHGGVVDHILQRPLRERELLALLMQPLPKPAATANAPVPNPVKA
jgi:DNA-binding NtrC family response regulator